MAEPKLYRGIMVSSTFCDLEDHRRDVIGAIEKLGFRANVMETSGARADKDVIDASINMVRDSAAFVGVIGHRYGQTPECPLRNPGALSISELEFNEAMRLGRPILLFIMGDQHPVTVADVETSPENKVKLDAFRERAKQMRADGAVERIYEVFNSRGDFAKAASIALGKLSPALEDYRASQDQPPEAGSGDSIETTLPPELRAVPRYLGSHEFVGRAAELSKLDDWCAAADQHPMLLFEAIGGSGKSMVTWTWLTERATEVRGDWAGRFWFSFYEGGATMTRFCREALAYVTSQPVTAFRKEKIGALLPRLISELEASPWLLVLDGLERILVAYHRIDAPQLRDEDAEAAEDQIAHRDPRAAINPDDEELLRQLTGAAPSKILVTSRLTPQALINRSGTPLPGVRREILPGLRPPDAETLLRSCGVSGDSKVIQEYLQRNCDCHPLVIGALAGLVNNYLPDRGNFDLWLADPEAGGSLDLADLDLTQRRNHILDAAIEALPEPARRLLQTLSLLQGGADYATLKEFNPHRPPPPERIEEPRNPERGFRWAAMDSEERQRARTAYEQASARRAGYVQALDAWEKSPELRSAAARFAETITELEVRGLLQYDRSLKRYDLHPVVRGVSAGRLGEKETSEIGRNVVDHFSSRPHDPWEQAETLEDLAPAIQVVATLTRMNRFKEALSAYLEISRVLSSNLMALGEIQRLTRPFFPEGWDGPIILDNAKEQCDLLLCVASAFYDSDDDAAANLDMRLVDRLIKTSLSISLDIFTRLGLRNMSAILGNNGRLAEAARIKAMTLELAEEIGSDYEMYESLHSAYWAEIYCGAADRADALWSRLDPKEHDWGESYTSGETERTRAQDLFWRGELTEEELAEAERLCRKGKDRSELIRLLRMRGDWHLARAEPQLAIAPLTEALRLCRQSGVGNMGVDIRLALARIRTGDTVDARDVAERLDREQWFEVALPLAELWYELGERAFAIAAALRGYKSACASGEPFVYRYYLDRAGALLRKFGEVPPAVPIHNPANDTIFEWEEAVHSLIQKRRKDREERERQSAERETDDRQA
jgi:hypothetical protein